MTSIWVLCLLISALSVAITHSESSDSSVRIERGVKLLGLNLGGSQDREEKEKNGRKGSRDESLLGTVEGTLGVGKHKKRQRKNFLGDLKLLHHGKKPNRREWTKQIKGFCHRFPGHPNCRKGKVPHFGDLGDMLKSVNTSFSQFLPRIPKIHIKDPLENVNPALAGEILERRKRRREQHKEAAGHIRNLCKKRKCREQTPQTVEAKELLTNKIFEFEEARTDEDPSDSIQLRFDRVQQLKESLLEEANLTAEVVPMDNGVFDKDLLLTEAQSNFLLNEVGKGGQGNDEIPLPEEYTGDDLPEAPPTPTGEAPSAIGETATATAAPGKKKKRSAIFFESNLVQKWDLATPIQFVLDSSLAPSEKNDVRAAISEIQQKSCIRFQEVPKAPSGFHMNYYKIDSPTFCGLSYVGRTSPANPVYLSFGCENNRGVALHETMHALGVAHQHLRTDRDQHITVDWSNINPQQYDAFVVVDSKMYTSYGVKYDYGSIMHYNAYTAAINVAKPTMLPKVDFSVNVLKLGQRQGMSPADVAVLNKMYCKPASCDDKNVYCGAWALKDLCTAPGNAGWMVINCRKSCNLC